MPAARAQAFTAVTEAGAAAPRSHGTAADGAVLAGRRVAVGLQRVGDPADRGDHEEDLRLVRRLLR
jgi:hypothetical protein